jgi:cysteine sulfinate desulfinase/cysteine desulfurase-like protein
MLGMGQNLETAKQAIRISLGPQTTDADVDYCLEVIPEVIRSMERTRVD